MGNLSWQRPGSEEEEDQRAAAAGTGDTAEADDMKVAGPADEDAHHEDTHHEDTNERFGDDEAHREQTPAAPPVASEAPVAPETSETAFPVEDDEEATEHSQSTPGAEQPVEERLEQFMDPDAATNLRERWRDVQSSFVDDPKLAVQQADELASEVLDALNETLTERKNTLDSEWRTGDDSPDTEKLRLALRGYRDFFDRMLSI